MGPRRLHRPVAKLLVTNHCCCLASVVVSSKHAFVKAKASLLAGLWHGHTIARLVSDSVFYRHGHHRSALTDVAALNARPDPSHAH